MHRTFAKMLLFGILVTVALPARAADQGAQRTLSYAFTYGMNQNTEVHNSGFNDNGNGGSGSGSGVDTYSNHAGDSGTISVAVAREEADHGLVVAVSETAQNGHNAKAATCVVYGTGTVICDPNATVYPEEYTVLRFLGANFVDPALIDANRHWRVSSNGPGYAATSDYTLGKPVNGVASIAETRNLGYLGGVSGKADVTSTISYDLGKQVPLAIDETTVNHLSRSGHDSDQTTHVVVKLTADSMGAAAH